MPALTEALVLGKSKSRQLQDVKILNLCGQGLDDVSILFEAPHLEVLSMSVNSLTSLRHFAFCPHLQQLFLRQNTVADLSELRYLMPLKQLSTLSLQDNPVAQLEYYRAFVCAHLPQLSTLDSAPVDEHDRAAAAALRSRHGLLQPATADDVLAEDLQAAASKQQQQQQQQAEDADDAARVRLAPVQQEGKQALTGGGTGAPPQGSGIAGAQLQQPLVMTTTATTPPPPPCEPSLMPAAAGTSVAAGSRSAAPPPAATMPGVLAMVPMRPESSLGIGGGPGLAPTAPQAAILPAMHHHQHQQHHQASTNVLYAVMALLHELDAPALRIVQREVALLL